MDKATKKGEKCDLNNKNDKKGSNNSLSSLEKSYFDVLGLCCSSEVPLIEKILKPLEGVVEVSVIVPSRTVIVVHDTLLISQQQIVKALNQARLEANVRVIGKASYRGKWPSPYVICSGLLLALSLLQYVYHPLEWLAVAAVVVGIWPILLRGLIAIKNFTLDVNILMLIAVVGTLVLKDYLEAGTIVFLFTIAEWLESRASQKATAVMSSLLSMTPQQATIAETGEVVSVKDVKLNTILAVKAGELVPIDGIVVEGTCEVDEKTLTGESFPVPKQIDSNVWAGTVNINGYVSIKTITLAEDCAVAKMARLVEEAQNNKSSVQRLIDKCAKYYTPAVVLISAGLAVVPVSMKLHDKKHWFYLALVVLVSACPCGLILSTPVATFCALSRAATSGLLIKGGDYLELLAKVKHIAFDKTGTLTRGEFTLKGFRSLADDVSSKTLLYWVSSIESKSSHPIATVLVEYGRSQCVEPKPENVNDFQNFPGEGVFGNIDGRDIYIGNQKLSQRANCSVASNVDNDDENIKEALTCGYIYSGGAVIGTFSLSDDCRSGAFEALKELKSMGVRTAMLTGDSLSTAIRAQEQLGQALDAVHAELLPQDKARIITGYKQQGPTAMVGDGVNDAPALATADVGISMGVSGSALATETGHVILMSNDIRKIPKAIKLARTTRRKVIENIIFSITTKAGVLAVAIAGHPLVWLAVLVDVATCLIVIGNSMLLLGGSDHSTHNKSRCFGWFSSHHSHKAKCCSKNAAAKTCGFTKCSSPCQNTKFESLGFVKCSSQSCQTTNPKTCCSSNGCLTTIPDPCESAGCSSPPIGNFAEKSQQCCSASFKAEDMSESAHDTHESRCHSHECASECGSDNPHSSNTCKSDYLDLLESQVSSCVKHASSEIEHHHHHHHHDHDHDHHHHHNHNHNHNHMGSAHQQCEQKSSCCENNDEDKVKCEGGQDEITTIKPQCNSHVFHDDKKNGLKHEHGASSHEAHHHHHGGHHHNHNHHHHHHHVLSDKMCHVHANELTKHACSSLRKREIGACCKSFRKECCSSKGHLGPAFGGLTEIVTE